MRTLILGIAALIISAAVGVNAAEAPATDSSIVTKKEAKAQKAAAKKLERKDLKRKTAGQGQQRLIAAATPLAAQTQTVGGSATSAPAPTAAAESEPAPGERGAAETYGVNPNASVVTPTRVDAPVVSGPVVTE
jgi:hypothetical protein